MKHTIETSTAALHHFVYHGNYETYVGEHLGCVPYEDQGEAQDEISKLALEIIAEAFGEIFPSHINYDDFSLKYIETFHPSFYNFQTDSIIFNFNFTENVYAYLMEYIENNERFDKYLADHYTSYDGFISFTPNNRVEWMEGWKKNDLYCGSALLSFVIHDALADYEIRDYTESFEDQAVDILNGYFPFEYAVKYDNGYTAIVKWDGYDGDEHYNAWLLDENDNVVNTMQIEDGWCTLHGSAFAAWAYNIEYDLTNGYIDYKVKSSPCDVPEIETE